MATESMFGCSNYAHDSKFAIPFYVGSIVIPHAESSMPLVGITCPVGHPTRQSHSSSPSVPVDDPLVPGKRSTPDVLEIDRSKGHPSQWKPEEGF